MFLKEYVLEPVLIVLKMFIAIAVVQLPAKHFPLTEKNRSLIREALVWGFLFAAIVVQSSLAYLEAKKDGVGRLFANTPRCRWFHRLASRFGVFYRTLDQQGAPIFYFKCLKFLIALGALVVPTTLTAVFFYKNYHGRADQLDADNYNMMIITNFGMTLAELVNKFDSDPIPNLVRNTGIEVPGEFTSIRLIVSRNVPPVSRRIFYEVDPTARAELAGINV